jgi:hypothetical protein
MTTTQTIELLIRWAKAAAARAREDDRGEVTEKVILVAIFAALALAIGTIIVLKVTDKANSIPTE